MSRLICLRAGMIKEDEEGLARKNATAAFFLYFKETNLPLQ